jgi:hypothetical protein
VLFGGGAGGALKNETWVWVEGTGESGVGDQPPTVVISGEAELLPAQPNPFNPRTELRFALTAPQVVSLKIYDLQGRLVRTVVDNQSYAAGTQGVDWDGTRDDGQRVSSGVYLVRMTAGRYVGNQPLMLLK